MKDLYFAFDRAESEFEFFLTKKEAVKYAECVLKDYADAARWDGWPDEMAGMIGMGKIVLHTAEKDRRDRKDFTAEEWKEMGCSIDHDHIVNYELEFVD